MRFIRQYLKVFDKSLIRKCEVAKQIYPDFLINSYKLNDHKLWNTIIMYQEILSNSALSNNNCTFAKLLLWLDKSEIFQEDESWSKISKVIDCLIAFIETKNFVIGRNVIDKETFLLAQKYLSKQKAQFNHSSAYDINYSLNDYLKELDSFLVNQNYDKEFGHLIKIAFLHFQLIDLKPFTHNNNITARLVCSIYLTLITKNEIPKIAPSFYLLQNKKRYFELLENCQKKLSSINQYLNFILLSIIEGCNTSKVMLDEIEKLIDENVQSILQNIESDDILKIEIKRFCNELLIDKNSFKTLLKTNDINVVNSFLNKLINDKIIKYVSNDFKNKLIFVNVWNYLIEQDKEIIKCIASI